MKPLVRKKTKTAPVAKREPTLEQKLTMAQGKKDAGETLLSAATTALDNAVASLDAVHDEITAEISRLGLLADTASAQAVSAQIKADGARQIG